MKVYIMSTASVYIIAAIQVRYLKPQILKKYILVTQTSEPTHRNTKRYAVTPFVIYTIEHY